MLYPEWPWPEEPEKAIAVEEGAACACSHIQFLTELWRMLMSSIVLYQARPVTEVNYSSHPHPQSSLAMVPQT